MEKWRRVWREGFVPQLSSAGLRALRTALAKDDQRLMQGATCYPPLMEAIEKRTVEAACALGFCGWQGDRVETISELNSFFTKRCDWADLQFSEPAACRFFLNWFDDTPRDEMRRELLAEVELALAQRDVAAA